MSIPSTESDYSPQLGLIRTAKVTFYDAQGIPRKVVQLHERDAQTSINLRDLPADIYYLRVTANEKLLLEKQLVVQH